MNDEEVRKTAFDCAKHVARGWLATDAPTWLHLLKTLVAVTSAMGLAMLLQLPQPRVAMTTAVVLMQPLAGMVLGAKVHKIIHSYFFGILVPFWDTCQSYGQQVRVAGLTGESKWKPIRPWS